VNLSLLNFQATVQLGAAACQKASTRLLNLAVGSVTRAIIEAAASIALWLQYLIVLVWQGARLSTSIGVDVDTFVGDFGQTREAAVSASGPVTFSRYSTAASALITPYFNADGTINAAGAQVLTIDSSQTFGVITDTANTLWNAGLGGYLIAIGTATATVTVRALVPGLAGNVQAGSVGLLASAIPYVDLVTNTTAFSNGEDAESDAALKARFAVYVATRAEATKSAVENAINSVQLGLSYAVIENTLPNGQPDPGFFTVTVDDGTGSPPSTLLSLVFSAVDAVRPIGSTFTVQPPAVLIASVNMTIAAAAGYSKPTLQAGVAQTIQVYINGLGIGAPLSYTRLSALAYSVAGVSSVSNVLLNNGAADIGGGPTQVVKATAASVVIN
jgi:uncharacterized phage protein gp47/JayE